MNTDLITYKRSGDTTTVSLGDKIIGKIIRRQGSDSSPRGGAYRTFHDPYTAAGRKLAPCWTRKEAVEDLLRYASRPAAFTSKDEAKLHAKRRDLINRGVEVSLIGWDPATELYTFNTL